MTIAAVTSTAKGHVNMRELHTRVEKTLALLERQFPVDTEKFACDVRQLLAAQAVQPESIDTPEFRALMSDLIARKAKQSDLVRFIDDKLRGADADRIEAEAAIERLQAENASMKERGMRIIENRKARIEELSDENAELTAKCNHIMTEHGKVLAEVEKLRKDAEQISTLREAVIDAADEWARYVEVDSAPRRCSEHVGMAFDAAVAAKLKGTSK